VNLARSLAKLLTQPTGLIGALCLSVALPLPACKNTPPDGTSNPPGSEEAGKRGKRKRGDDGGAEGGEEGGEEGGAAEPPKSCDAKVADTPTALFGDQVLVRPPINVEIVEDNPTFATTFTSGGFVSACEATVDRMSLFVFQNDKKKNVKAYMDEVINTMLANSGFKNGTRGKNHVESEVQLDTEIEYPAGDGAPPAKLYISVKKLYQFALVVVYQTRPDEFGALLPTFKASAESLIVLPPDA
jgi:hypothetical protein